jgi:HAD superfamily hydrolase (TIGR01490 family)
MVTAAAQERLFRQRGLGDAPIERLRDDALRHIAGLDQAIVADLAAEIGLGLSRQVLPGAAMLVRRHLSAGDYVVILSASPQQLVDAVASGLGVQRAVGTRAAVSEGRFTGSLEGPFCYGVGKIARLAAELGSDALNSAAAYADSASDIPLLESSHEPVAVNPDRRLLRVAKQKGWPILHFRWPAGLIDIVPAGEDMAKNRDDELFDLLRARGLRKKLAQSIAALNGNSRRAGAKGERLARQTVEDLTLAAEDIRKRVLRSDLKRAKGARKAAQTRARNASKRTASAKKAAQTRAEVTRPRARATAGSRSR